MRVSRDVIVSSLLTFVVFCVGFIAGGTTFVVWYGNPYLHDDTSDSDVYGYVGTGTVSPNTNPAQVHTEATHYLAATGSTSICIANPKIWVFMYHYVREYDPHDPPLITNLSLDPNLFEAHLKFIRSLEDKGQVYVAKLSEIDAFRKSQCFPNKNIFVLTADDGWDDTYTRIYWLARKYNLPFGMGLITSRLNTPGFLTDAEVREMVASGYMEIYSHSVNHVDQDKLTLPQETHEICDSRTILQNLFHQPIIGFIYPAGHVSTNSVNILKSCGYSYAFTTQIGVNHVSDLGSYLIHRERVANNWPYNIFLRYIQ